MIKKFYILSLIFVFGFAFCLTNGFADKFGEFVDEATGDQMYWSDPRANKIQRANLDGSNIQDLVTRVEVNGIALDVAGGKMYWTDANPDRIQRANLDGSNIEDLITTRFLDLADIALDITGGKMYWTDNNANKIQRANLDGSNVQDLITGLEAPNNIALDIAGGKMYWTDNNANKIQRANLDGSNVEYLITQGPGLSSPIGIALDVAGGKMYWVDTGADKIQRANLDGSNIQDLITGLDHPQCITLDVAGGKMYWTDAGTRNIQRANLDGSNIEDLITHGLSHPRAIALGIPAISPPSPAIAFNPPTVADQTFTVGSSVNLTLPVATGGTTPYGLVFDAAAQMLSGTPATEGTTAATYRCTDAMGASAELTFTIEVIAAGPGPLDVNGDGQVTVIDLAVVALFYGMRAPAGTLPADVNVDGSVNILDLTAVAQGIDAAGESITGLSLIDVEAALVAVAEQAADLEAVAEAPIRTGFVQGVVCSNVVTAFANARHLMTSNVYLEKRIPAVLEELLHLLAGMVAIPKETALLPNYPNPFNPETWIPYHLSEPADVTLRIYAANGQLIRRLALGHQPAGVYESRGRAAYWDGRNQIGEPVASGVYLYTLSAREFTATRKMLIRK